MNQRPKSQIKIVPLRDFPEHRVFFADEFEAEWPDWYGPNGSASAIEDLNAFANPDGVLPVAVIALGQDGSPIGIAALKAESISSHKHLTPWASAGYVIPERRGEGIGTSLVSALLTEAGRLGFETVYCAASRAASLLRREGWEQIDKVQLDGEQVLVFSRAVSPVGREANESD